MREGDANVAALVDRLPVPLLADVAWNGTTTPLPDAKSCCGKSASPPVRRSARLPARNRSVLTSRAFCANPAPRTETAVAGPGNAASFPADRATR
jgi:hypothetical protein